MIINNRLKKKRKKGQTLHQDYFLLLEQKNGDGILKKR